ncbi:hypothetical protein B296_00025280 [Ensete ventricosum]|uniref:Uncharacterized protein n=1 Tax=Ensete ventricosum TaxID=4639 RepID=A0A427A882_ENSVE|nr:hypothetical protein B296_00025280 [Ensete ventricosum]
MEHHRPLILAATSVGDKLFAVAAPLEKLKVVFDVDKLIWTSTRVDKSIHLIPVFTILQRLIIPFSR